MSNGSDGYYFIAVFEDEFSEEDMERAELLFEPYRLTDQAVILYSKHPLPTTVARDLFGLDEDKPGVVFKLNGSYAGYYHEGFWSWMKED